MANYLPGYLPTFNENIEKVFMQKIASYPFRVDNLHQPNKLLLPLKVKNLYRIHTGIKYDPIRYRKYLQVT